MARKEVKSCHKERRHLTKKRPTHIKAYPIEQSVLELLLTPFLVLQKSEKFQSAYFFALISFM
jgi:hypothetical protein